MTGWGEGSGRTEDPTPERRMAHRLSARARLALWCAGLVTVSGAAVLLLSISITDNRLRVGALGVIDVAAQAAPPPTRIGASGQSSGSVPSVAGQQGGRPLGPLLEVTDGTDGPSPVGSATPAGGGRNPQAPIVAARLEAGHEVVARTLAEARRIGLQVLAGLALASVLIGWWVARRLLLPVRRLTETALTVSHPGSGTRIAMVGPHDELRAMADTFDGMLDRLDASFESQRRFVADASHELRTPVTVLRSEVEVTLDDPHADAQQLRASLERTGAELERLSALVEGLLRLSRAETLGPVESTDLADVAESAIAGVRRMLARHLIDDATAGTEPSRLISSDLAPSPVLGDPLLLDRLVANLVENAARHNVAGGLVRVMTRTDGRHAVLTVENDGPVVDPATIAGLFERFRRPDGPRRRHDGHGLGMAIAAAAVATHGGTIEAVARAGGGLAVTVRLTRADASTGLGRDQPRDGFDAAPFDS